MAQVETANMKKQQLT